MNGRFVSYAQHGEDVILWRALGGRTGVFYVDVGAFDPTYDSVTRSLYERGWRGMNIEAQPDRITAFEDERPEDINIAVAIGDRDGAITLTVPANPGWASTLEPRATGADPTTSRALEVPLRSLSTVLAEHSIDHVDVLKVDVEGGEPAVVRGMLTGPVRPTVCVVEGVAPGLGRAAGDAAVGLLVDAGYTHCMFDGLNHYLTIDDDLVDALSVPANPLDEYVPHALVHANETVERLLRERDEPAGTAPRVADDAPGVSTAGDEEAPPVPDVAARRTAISTTLQARAVDEATVEAPPSRQGPTPASEDTSPIAETTVPDAAAAHGATERAPVIDAEARRARRRAMFVRMLQGSAVPLLPSRAIGVPRLGPALERLAPSEAVTILYRLILGRNPDAKGLADWSGHVEAGLPLIHVARRLVQSDEAALQPVANQARIRADLRRWSSLMAAEELGAGGGGLHVYTPGVVAREILVQSLYEVALQRSPSDEELAIQVQVLVAGTSREAMIRSFAAQPAARARLLGRTRRGPLGLARALLDRRVYLPTFRSLVTAAEQRRIAEVVRDLSATAGTTTSATLSRLEAR